MVDWRKGDMLGDAKLLPYSKKQLELFGPVDNSAHRVSTLFVDDEPVLVLTLSKDRATDTYDLGSMVIAANIKKYLLTLSKHKERLAASLPQKTFFAVECGNSLLAKFAEHFGAKYRNEIQTDEHGSFKIYEAN